MTLLWPWSMLAMFGVAAAAIWALRRPGRRQVVVASLSLWRQAAESPLPHRQRQARAFSWSWLALLAGATAAALAASRPVYQSRLPARSVAVAMCPSIELGEQGKNSLREAIVALLKRLDARDRVTYVGPDGVVDGPWPAWQAMAKLREQLRPIPFRSNGCAFPPWPVEAQHMYAFVPAGMDLPAGSRVSVIPVPGEVSPVTIDSLAAVELRDGTAQVFVAARNHTNQAAMVGVDGQALELEGAAAAPLASAAAGAKSIPAGGREGFVLTLPSAAVLRVQLTPPNDGLGQGGCLLRMRTPPRKVALIGRDSSAVRHFVEVHSGLSLEADPSQADIVVCVGMNPPSGKPALVIDPPSAPSGYGRAAQRGPVELKDGSSAVDDPVTASVDFSSVAVRQVAPWRRMEPVGQKVLLSVGRDVLALRNNPEELPPAQRSPRQVYLSFDIAEQNTNFAATPAFVIFMANAIGWLSPAGGEGRRVFDFSPPLALAAAGAIRQQFLPCVWKDQDTTANAVVPPNDFQPGVYWPAARPQEAVAVSLTGLKAGAANSDPKKVAVELPLPEPRASRQAIELWPGLLLVGMVLWLTGWYFRAHNSGRRQT